MFIFRPLVNPTTDFLVSHFSLLSPESSPADPAGERSEVEVDVVDVSPAVVPRHHSVVDLRAERALVAQVRAFPPAYRDEN